MSRFTISGLATVALGALLLSPLASQPPQPAARPAAQVRPKRVLAWGDTLTAFQHDSISHALATMERLGHESGAYEMYIRTDSQRLKRVPVVNAKSQLVGLISRADLVRELAYRWQCRRCGNLVRARRPPSGCPRCGAADSFEAAAPLPGVAACPTCGKPLDK